MRPSALGSCILFLLACLLSGCGASTSSSSNTTANQSAGTNGSAARIAIVVLENTSYKDVVGSPSAPYLNQLANQYGLATNYFADAHPSIGNYFMMTTGQIVTLDDNGYTGPFSGDNLAGSITAANKTWKVYAQSLPSTGYTGTDQGAYIKHHNPFAYFSNVVGTAQANNIVNTTQLATDISSGNLPDLLFIVPDNGHNSHDCPGGGTNCDASARVGVADTWVQQTVSGLLSSPAFSNGVLVITFDESDFTDFSFGGGHVATIVAGPAARQGVKSDSFHQHQNLLRLVCDRLNLGTCPGVGAVAGSMSEFLQATP